MEHYLESLPLGNSFLIMGVQEEILINAYTREGRAYSAVPQNEKYLSIAEKAYFGRLQFWYFYFCTYKDTKINSRYLAKITYMCFRKHMLQRLIIIYKSMQCYIPLIRHHTNNLSFTQTLLIFLGTYAKEKGCGSIHFYTFAVTWHRI